MWTSGPEKFIFHNKKSNISDAPITAFAHNVRSLSKHIHDMVSYDRIVNNEL